MKITTVVKVSTLAAALGLACLLPATLHAQADTAPDPDFFQISNTETATVQTARVAGTKEVKADFAGKVSLPYDVECSGKNLKAGQYLLSVKSQGTTRVVTIHGDGANVNIQAHVVPANGAASHSALLVRKSGEERKLEGVYVEALNATLYLETNTRQGVTQRLPIS